MKKGVITVLSIFASINLLIAIISSNIFCTMLLIAIMIVISTIVCWL